MVAYSVWRQCQENQDASHYHSQGYRASPPTIPPSLRGPSGTCARCGKGNHWARDCYSFGYYVLRNWRRGQPQASQAQGRCFNCSKQGPFCKDCRNPSEPASLWPRPNHLVLGNWGRGQPIIPLNQSMLSSEIPLHRPGQQSCNQQTGWNLLV